MKAAEAAVVIAALVASAAVVIYVIRRVWDALAERFSGEDEWRANYHIRNGNALVVVERGKGLSSEQRVVKELPPAPNPLEFQSDLASALDDAEIEAETLNRAIKR